jgi:hypothetical protein
VLSAGRIQGEGSIVSAVQIKLEPSYWHIWRTKNHQKKWIKIQKVTPPKIEGVKNSKKQTIKHYKVGY